MKFSDIPAHDEVKRQLVAMVDNNRMPHALLLEGKSGIGKMMLARALAQYIHCTDRHDGDSCGVCPACLQHQSFNHIDTHYAYPVIKLKNRTGAAISDDWAEQWRQFLTDSPYMDMNTWVELLGNANAQPQIFVDESTALLHKLNFTSHAARFKVVLMWLPERMNEACANKLLKLLEEPHDDTLFILVSNEPARILPTIYSRLQRVEVKRLDDATVAAYLEERYGVDPDAADGISHLAEGSILEAMSRFSASDESKQFLDMFMSLMRLAYQKKVGALRRWSVDVADFGREKCCRFLEYCERLTGENYIYNLRDSRLVRLDNEESRFSANFARFINERNVERIRSLFIDARRDIAGNANAKIVLFDIAVSIILCLK
ncbi:MAG: DNA polymerase III subunit delta [Bacteroidales bacterium]|nr:DNA polymerase III subunit delta [Bacteroidales bacterium]